MVNGNPATKFVPITPSDTARIGSVSGIFVGGAGVVMAEDCDGTVAPFNAAASVTIPIAPVRIMATGTTATGIVGLSNTRDRG